MAYVVRRLLAMALRFAVRSSVIARYLARISGVIAILEIVPAAVCAATGQWAMAWRFAVGTAVLGAVAVAVHVRRGGQGEQLQLNETLVVVVGAFALAALAGAAGLRPALPGMADALFEATSGVSTTGLTVVAEPEKLPFAYHVSRAWMQWLGGLGVVIFAMAVVVEPGNVVRSLLDAGGVRPDYVGNARYVARRAGVAYGILTGVAFAAYCLAGMPVGAAVVHALSSVSTGGYSTRTASLGAFAPAARITVVAVCVLASFPLWLYVQAWRKKSLRVFADLQVWIVIGAGALVAGVLALLVPGRNTLDLVLTAGSAQSTAGFSTISVEAFPPAAKLVLVGSMLAGGGLGSTAGGIKAQRLWITAKSFLATVRRTASTRHAVDVLRIQGRPLRDTDMVEALCVAAAFVLLVAVSWGVFVAHGFEPIDALFDVASAVGTVGLSTGVMSAGLPAGLKLMACLIMLAGRLEIVALIVVVYPATWIGRRKENNV